MASGGCNDIANSEIVIASAIDVEAEHITLYGLTTDGNASTGLSLDNATPSFFSDGVNKIN